jgi:hypothetical protein
MRSSLCTLVCVIAAGCAGGGQQAPVVSTTPSAVSRDSSRLLVPAGFGSLKQEDVAIRVARGGLQVQAIPLDETIIRLLSPDSYRALRDQLASRKPSFDSLARRLGLNSFSVWLVRFHGLEQGETPFSPMEFIVTSVGRDFRPIEVFPVTPGFGQQRLRQREVQQALYAFDPQVDVNQPLTVTYETTRNSDWPLILARIERERVLVRSRAGVKQDGRWRTPEGR